MTNLFSKDFKNHHSDDRWLRKHVVTFEDQYIWNFSLFQAYICLILGISFVINFLFSGGKWWIKKLKFYIFLPNKKTDKILTSSELSQPLKHFLIQSVKDTYRSTVPSFCHSLNHFLNLLIKHVFLGKILISEGWSLPNYGSDSIPRELAWVVQRSHWRKDFCTLREINQ